MVKNYFLFKEGFDNSGLNVRLMGLKSNEYLFSDILIGYGFRNNNGLNYYNLGRTS